MVHIRYVKFAYVQLRLCQINVHVPMLYLLLTKNGTCNCVVWGDCEAGEVNN